MNFAGFISDRSWGAPVYTGTAPVKIDMYLDRLKDSLQGEQDLTWQARWGIFNR